jgi:eight-cysteine-cluster-containing protein
MKFTKIVFGLIVITFLLVFIWFLVPPNTDEDKYTTTSTTTIPEHHGSSTHGKCSTDGDCFISGCNNEICQSKSEDPLTSICIYNPPYPKDLDYECRCVEKKCLWSI